MNEAETRAELTAPALKAAQWGVLMTVVSVVKKSSRWEDYRVRVNGRVRILIAKPMRTARLYHGTLFYG